MADDFIDACIQLRTTYNQGFIGLNKQADDLIIGLDSKEIAKKVMIELDLIRKEKNEK
jgi:hypothetical protein